MWGGRRRAGGKVHNGEDTQQGKVGMAIQEYRDAWGILFISPIEYRWGRVHNQLLLLW